ncbi:2'-5' RNA ligase family protein [Nocardia harenae]|uniref:2'-5' RNA ligase family protein n=1 Tax=Nocardia harenae TaxID=358707 RepID=UPI00082A8403|nr:2'-5' RNA ligase family protein [Nocardia harenae]
MTSTTDDAHLHLREGHTGPLGHYWFLTFGDAPELHALTKTCQQAIDPAFFDATPADELHLTLDRIAHDGASTPEQRASIAEAARRVCGDQGPITLTFDQMTNLRGAVGFAVSPAESVRSLRDTLRAATLSVFPDARVKDSSSPPHVTIAYPIFEDLQARAAATAETMNTTIDGVDVVVSEVMMVALEQRGRLYSWRVIRRVPLVADLE